MSVFERIEAQQGAERSAVWMVGEQLKDILRREPQNQPIVEEDLENEAMSIAECEKKIKAFADTHEKGGFSCVTPDEAERIIREFYGLCGTERKKSGKIVDLADFF